ncbi:UNVERIFIED_CONTAM: hypothetical protein Slati_1024700 [Sesamum latifolium]|uniref:Reverse transcriptase zinc-binding domain-containing protein n=1 Tax=Sesamum latifolium TaxID=2727402 RepID=A0AAW2XYG9_9LAMI
MEPILGIPISCSRSDTLRWHYEEHGRYSVRSAYHLMFHTERSIGSSSSGPPNWNFIWRTEVPPKVRLFAWKICRDALPTGVRLMRRGEQTGSGCIWCGEGNEDLLHVLLCCHYPRLVWALSAIPSSSLACA